MVNAQIYIFSLSTNNNLSFFAESQYSCLFMVLLFLNTLTFANKNYILKSLFYITSPKVWLLGLFFSLVWFTKFGYHNSGKPSVGSEKNLSVVCGSTTYQEQLNGLAPLCFLSQRKCTFWTSIDNLVFKTITNAQLYNLYNYQ